MGYWRSNKAFWVIPVDNQIKIWLYEWIIYAIPLDPDSKDVPGT